MYVFSSRSGCLGQPNEHGKGVSLGMKRDPAKEQYDDLIFVNM